MSLSIHVWRVDVDAPLLDRELLLACLDAKERQRAGRFARPLDASRYVVAHSALRCLLATRLGMAPGEIAFEHGEHGKPYLVGANDLEFNLSHSGRWALCAIGSGAAPGVDVEQPRTAHDFRAIARRWFTPREQAALAPLDDASFATAFRRLWVCKEALLKSDGGGISSGLARFELAVDGDAARLTHVDNDPALAKAWTLYNFVLDGNYPAAVAVPAPDVSIELHDLTLTDLSPATETPAR